jgi:hypothetical protein
VGEDLDSLERNLELREGAVTSDLLSRVLRTAVKVAVVVIATLLVLTAIGWVIRTVSDGDGDDVTTVERR